MYKNVQALLLAAAILTGSSLVVPSMSAAQPAAPPESTSVEVLIEEPPQDWFHLDEQEDNVRGISSDRAYRTLLQGKTPKKAVVVAVLDSGIDIEHEDLKANIWVNADEIPANGVDDDENGYVDDVHGWNFIGGPGGKNVDIDSYELTREYARLSAEFEGVDPSGLSPEQREEYEYYREIVAEFEAKQREIEQQYEQISAAYEAAEASRELLHEYLETDSLRKGQLDSLVSIREDVQNARNFLLYLDQNGITPEAIRNERQKLENQLRYSFNPEYDSREIVGDDYADLNERYYGNDDVIGPDPGHGTAVAGVIAAVRDNDLGMEGIANNVRIMVVRTVPNGDERDKDVANAIRYAVDNGADVINMSFGKSYSPNKDIVDAAVQYADEKGVLLVHAAGNDGADIDEEPNYPTKDFLDNTGQADNWIEVGASSWGSGDNMVPWWSNYGSEEVDVFAPGAAIYTTSPGQDYTTTQGTSLSAPVVTGVAALLEAYYPELTAEQLRDIIMSTATRYPGEEIPLPGDSGEGAEFAQLSVSGGIVNVYEALKMAGEMAN